MDNQWDWNRMIPSWDWHGLVLARWPGWIVNSEVESPNFVTFEIVNEVDKSSREIAVEWDDLSEGQFHYRDYTKYSLPFVSKGEMYKAIFYFQYEQDAIKFAEKYNGKLNQKLTGF